MVQSNRAQQLKATIMVVLSKGLNTCDGEILTSCCIWDQDPHAPVSGRLDGAWARFSGIINTARGKRARQKRGKAVLAWIVQPQP